MFRNDINLITTPELIQIYLNEFLQSPERQLMIDGEKYYLVENTEIMSREMFYYRQGQDGEPYRVKDESKPNKKLAHGFLHNLVEDKVNYLLAKPYTLTCDNDDSCIDAIVKILGRKFQAKRMTRLGVEASNKGIAWLHIYINAKGEFKTMVVPSEQIRALWADDEHEELQAVIRFYDVDEIEGKTQKTVMKVEYWTEEGVAFYVDEGHGLILDSVRYLGYGESSSDFVPHFLVGDSPGQWGMVPFIPFKNNDFEKPDLQFIKTLVDNYDLSRSDIANTLEEIKSSIFALRGYGGADLGEFLRDVSYFRAISLDSDPDAGVDVLSPQLDTAAATEHYSTLKKDIFDFGQGVDKNSDKLGNSPSGIALKFIYSGLDLKCNRMENAFSEGFETLLYFVNKYLELTTGTEIDRSAISIVFNRDIAINESQAIADCQTSVGIISDETIRENHPWVKDVSDEKKRIEKEEQTPNDDDMFRMPKENENEDG